MWRLVFHEDGKRWYVTPGGSKKYYCEVPECEKLARKNRLCQDHGDPLKRCTVDGCTHVARKEGVPQIPSIDKDRRIKYKFIYNL